MSDSKDKTVRITVPGLAQKKRKGEKIVMLTAYDFPTARLVDQSGADIVLVGDSLGMEELGFSTTIPVTLDMMVHHTAAVRRGTASALVLADMPFGTCTAGADDAVRHAVRLMQEGGANAVKIEGGAFLADTVRRVVQAGVPVMAHVGFTPQSVNQMGTRMQGKDEAGARQVMADAQALEEAGAFGLLLELIPPALAAQITQTLSVPTIGIGAGAECDGQVLVTSDLLDIKGGAYTPFKHVRQYAHIGDDILRALSAYGSDVRDKKFP